MLSIETRRDPVNQAAAAFLLPAVLSAAGIFFKLVSPVPHGHPIRAFDVVALATMAAVGLLVLRGSRAALIAGTTLFALVSALGLLGGLLVHAPVASIVFLVGWNGVLLFLMARGIVAMRRQR